MVIRSGKLALKGTGGLFDRQFGWRTFSKPLRWGACWVLRSATPARSDERDLISLLRRGRGGNGEIPVAAFFLFSLTQRKVRRRWTLR
ncbi:MAG: hypothetical protein JWM99_145 [Verrucomicrobiales bacterium]|nr:hypothetical protein [Verrucomicrobiales bacterium]